MKTKKVSRYYCDFCNKGKLSKPWMVKHERHCYKNPDRVPYEGELAYIGFTGKVADYGCDDALPDGLRWLEWQEYDPLPKWWPGEGMIFHAGGWHKVEGHKIIIPTGAHGYGGGPPPSDEWPICGNQPLNEWGAANRWEALKQAKMPEIQIPENNPLEMNT